MIKFESTNNSQECTNTIVFTKFTIISCWKPETKRLVFTNPKAIQKPSLDLSFTCHMGVDAKTGFYLGLKLLKPQLDTEV